MLLWEDIDLYLLKIQVSILGACIAGEKLTKKERDILTGLENFLSLVIHELEELRD